MLESFGQQVYDRQEQGNDEQYCQSGVKEHRIDAIKYTMREGIGHGAG
jgi:hypothetical protein